MTSLTTRTVLTPELAHILSHPLTERVGDLLLAAAHVSLSPRAASGLYAASSAGAALPASRLPPLPRFAPLPSTGASRPLPLLAASRCGCALGTAAASCCCTFCTLAPPRFASAAGRFCAAFGAAASFGAASAASAAAATCLRCRLRRTSLVSRPFFFLGGGGCGAPCSAAASSASAPGCSPARACARRASLRALLAALLAA